MKLKRIAAMLTVAVMAVSLAACGGNTGTNTESSQNPKENAEAQAVHLNLAESWGFEYFYTILTPEVSSSGYDITYYLTSFYDTLFEYNSEGEVVGVLAEDWSMSEDGKTYTFQIKQGVKFSDGSDLTAEDVAKSILAVPVNLGQYNGSYGRLSTIIEDAVATDEYTVELHLTQPYYNTLRELCLANPFGIVSSEQFNEDLTAKQESFRSATYGTGPYMYAGDNDGQTWNFVRNPNYWGEAPEVDSFSIKYIPDNDAKILAIELTPQSAQMMDWYAMIQSGDYGLTIFKTQGGYYDPAMVITNINPSTSMDPILMQIGASQPELAALVDELDSATDEARIQEIYNTILTTMADQCLTTPLIYTRQLAIYSDAVASYTFPTDASFTSVQNIHLN